MRAAQLCLAVAKEVQRWLADNQIKTIYIDPGSPWQNGFVESFHGMVDEKQPSSALTCFIIRFLR